MPLVPDLVIVFITAPLNFPYSASKLLVISRNSSTESRLGISPAPRLRPSLTSPPFTRNALAVSRWPFTERLPAFGEYPPETDHSCLQAEEVQVAAAIQWERQHFLRFDHVAQLRVFGLDLHGIGRDFDHFIDTPNLQRDVDAQLVVHFQVDIRRVVLFESGCCHRHLVSSGRQSQDAVGTVCS